MCLTIRLPVSRPLVSAFASAFLRRPSKNSADFTGHRARETPNCLPIIPSRQKMSRNKPSNLDSMGDRNHTLCGTSSSTGISSHWDSLLVLLDILKELDCSLQFPSVYRLS